MMSRACGALSDLEFSSDDSSSSEEDEKVKRKPGNFTGLCLMGKSSRHISDFTDQDQLLCKVFHENKRLNLELESASSKIATLRSMYNDMSAKSCDNCNMIMVNYADMWLIHSHFPSLLDGVRLEL
jgi:hypothetical protein